MSTEPEVQTIDVQPSQLEIIVSKSGLDKQSEDTLKNAFTPLFQQAEQWKSKVDGIVVTDIKQVREMRLARETRLALKEIRTTAEKTRKALKEDSLRRGKAIDGVYNVLEFLIKPLETRLEDMEKFAERQEEKPKDALAGERAEALKPFGIDLTLYNLRDMNDTTFADLLNGTRLAQEARLAAEMKAEADRIEKARQDAEDRAKQRAENERLKKEAAEREELLRAERVKAEAERKAIEEKAEAARRAAEAKARAEREAIEAKARAEKEAAEAALRKEREESAKKQADADKARKAAEAALAKQKADEAKRIAADKEAARKAALAPDKDKILAFAAELRAIAVPNIGKKAELLRIVDQCWNELQKMAEGL